MAPILRGAEWAATGEVKKRAATLVARLFHAQGLAVVGKFHQVQPLHWPRVRLVQGQRSRPPKSVKIMP